MKQSPEREDDGNGYMAVFNYYQCLLGQRDVDSPEGSTYYDLPKQPWRFEITSMTDHGDYDNACTLIREIVYTISV